MTDYAAISSEGELTFGKGEWRDEVGPEGPARVALHPSMPLAGFVNDCGLVLRERYARNVHGGLLLVALGARVQPYAGPVVVTGWHTCPGHVPCDVPLTRDRAAHIERLHADVGRALASEPVAAESAISSGAWPGWTRDMRHIAEEIRTGEAPPIQIITGGEL